jgi:hypothetical protein
MTENIKKLQKAKLTPNMEDGSSPRKKEIE